MSRDVLQEPSDDGDEGSESTAVIDVFPEEKVQAAGALIAAVFSETPKPKKDECLPRDQPPPNFCPSCWMLALESGRSDWPTGLCRRLWEFLLEQDAAQRAGGKSPEQPFVRAGIT